MALDEFASEAPKPTTTPDETAAQGYAVLEISGGWSGTPCDYSIYKVFGTQAEADAYVTKFKVRYRESLWDGEVFAVDMPQAAPPPEAMTLEEWDIVDKLLYREGRLNIMFKLRRLRPVVDTEPFSTGEPK